MCFARPTFYLLRPSYSFPAERGPRMLGALCENMDDPCSAWKPDNAAKVLSGVFSNDNEAYKAIEVRMEPCKHALDRTKSRNVRGGLEETLQGAWGKTRSDTYNIEAQWMRTVRLPQHYDMFACITKDETVRKFREERKDQRYFMITGYKSCLNGVVVKDSNASSTSELNVQVPLELVLNATGVPVPPGVLPSVGFCGSWSTSWRYLESYSLPGEVIIALEYREILRRSWISRILNHRKNDIEERKLAKRATEHRPETAMYGGRGQSEDSNSEIEEDSEDDDIPEPLEYLQQSWIMEKEGDDAVVLGMKVNQNAELSGIFLED